MSKELETIKSFQNKRIFDVTYDDGTQKHFETKTIGELFPNEINKIETELKDAEKNKKEIADTLKATECDSLEDLKERFLYMKNLIEEECLADSDTFDDLDDDNAEGYY